MSLRRLLENPGQMAAAVAGIALGVCLATAIGILNHSTLETFRRTIDAVTGKAALQVRSHGSALPEDLLAPIRETAGVRLAVPLLRNLAYLQTDGGEVAVTVFGMDLVEISGTGYLALQGEEDEVIEDPLLFLNQKDSILVSESLARRHGYCRSGYCKGVVVRMTTAHGVRRFAVRGVFQPPGRAKLYAGNLAVMDLYAAQEAFEKKGKLDRIDLVLEEDADPAAVAAELRLRLGPAYKVESPAERLEYVARMLHGLRSFLSALAVVSLLVGAFLVYNTVELTLSRRHFEIGMLRCIGAERQHLAALLAAEAAALGTLGSVLGVPAGVATARLLSHAVSDTVTTMFFHPVVVRAIAPTAADSLLYASLGLVTAVIASFPAIHRGCQVPPLLAVCRPGGGGRRRRGPTQLVLAGIALGSATLAVIASSEPGTAAGSAATVCLILGLALLTLPLSPAAARSLQPLASRCFGVSGRLACDNLRRAETRTAVTVGAIATGLCLTTMVATLLLSMEQSIEQWIEQTLNMDLLVSSVNAMPGLDQPLSEEIQMRLAALPGVEAVHLLRLRRIEYRGRRIALKAYSLPPSRRGRIPFAFAEGNPATALEALRAGTAVLVSENFARHFGSGVGGQIELPTPSGSKRFSVAGVITDFYSEQGVVVINRSTYKHLWHDPLIDSARIYATTHADIETLRQAVQERLGFRFNLVILSGREYHREMLARVSRAFRVSYAIEATALLIALLGIIDCLLVAVAQRRREMGILRAVGGTRAQIWGSLVVEGGLLGLLGAGFGLAAGELAAALWVFHLFERALGWVIHYRFPLVVALSSLLGAVAAGTCASSLAAALALREPITKLLAAGER